MRRPVLPVLLGVVAFAATPSLALDYQVRLYGAAAYVMPKEVQPPGYATQQKIEHAWGYEFGFELKTPKLVGFEVAYTDAKLDAQSGPPRVSPVPTIHFAPIHLSLNFHVVRTKTLSWWLGPTVSYPLSWGDLQNVDRTLGYGVSTGVIVNMVKPLAFQAGVRWIKLDLTEGAHGCGEICYSPEDTVGVDPLIVHVGLALRFGSGVAPVRQQQRADTQD